MCVKLTVTGIERQTRVGESVVATTNANGIIPHVIPLHYTFGGFSGQEIVEGLNSIVHQPEMQVAV